MGYLSPFTDTIFQFFYSLMPLPTIIYTGIGFTVFILGLVLYLTSTDFRPEDILQLLPRMVVSVQKRLDKRKIGASALIILGFMATFTFSDRLIAEAANPPGGGGPPLPKNICTNSTIGTSGCVVPSSYKGNTAAIGFTGVSTTSLSYVSTGFGSSLTIKNGGIVYISAEIVYSMTGGTGRVSFQIYKSTVGIPALNAAPAGGDSQVTSAEVNEDASATSVNFAIAYLGYDGFPGFPLTNGTHNFYYLAFKTSAQTLNLQGQGQMFMIEP